MVSSRRGPHAFSVYRHRARLQFCTRLFTIEILFTIVLTRSRMKGRFPDARGVTPMNRARVLRARDATSGYPYGKSPRGLYWSARRYLNDGHQHAHAHRYTYTHIHARVRAIRCATRRNICGLLLVLFARARARASGCVPQEDRRGFG